MKQSTDEFRNAMLAAFEAGTDVTPREGFYAGFDAGYEAGTQIDVWYRIGHRDGRRDVSLAVEGALARVRDAVGNGDLRGALYEIEGALHVVRAFDHDPESK